MLIAEELLLLAHDDLRTAPSLFDDAPYRLAGALLVELVIAGRVAPAPGGDGPVVVLDGAPTGRDELDRVLDLAAATPRHAAELVDLLARHVERPLLDGLVDRGLLRREDRAVWGLLRSTRWRTVDGPAVAALRRRVHGVLLDGAAPGDRTAALLTLAEGSGWLRPRVPRERRREADARMHELAATWWRGSPVREAAGAVGAAVAAVVSTVTLVLPTAT
ncbi:GOLPH3/VPS74 family protein [Krasilnikoviella flava]|uniref:Golgi phosphoprotein 3 (GPP34) n=1 Tax=Krasilnikoviella flava TaxID=526729 RepID=A0A1T5KFQ7_9MICO|nr:GPP34 family phosphoprotein [Krasilnikoviella flava]SKC62543.1 Golgi phosphoprotein 3 (GPP34) [Krasilnikoviella flava]